MDRHRHRTPEQHFLVAHMMEQLRSGHDGPRPDAACIDMRLPFGERLTLGQRGVGREVGMLRRRFGHGEPLGFVGGGPGRLVGERGVGQEGDQKPLNIVAICSLEMI